MSGKILFIHVVFNLLRFYLMCAQKGICSNNESKAWPNSVTYVLNVKITYKPWNQKTNMSIFLWYAKIPQLIFFFWFYDEKYILLPYSKYATNDFHRLVNHLHDEWSLKSISYTISAICSLVLLIFSLLFLKKRMHVISDRVGRSVEYKEVFTISHITL